MADAPIVDGVTPPAPAAPAPKVASPVTQWKHRLMIIVGVFYLLYVVWGMFLMLTLPAQGMEWLAGLGSLTMLMGVIVLLGAGALGVMRSNRSTIDPKLRKRGMILIAAVVAPGLLLSIAVVPMILRRPPLPITIVSPTSADQFVAPLHITFSLKEAVQILAQRPFFPIQYRWDLNGDGKTDQETVNPELTAIYDREGVYTLQVTMLDANGGVQLAARRFIIQRSVFSVLPVPVIINRPSVFGIANLIKDPSQLMEVRWDFDNDGKPDETGKELQMSHTFYRLGPTTVSVTVVLQNKTEVTYSRTFDVTDPPPLSFPVSIISEPKYLLSPPPFSTLWRVESKEPLGQVFWDFGDGEKGEGMKIAHTFQGRGNYLVTAKVYAKSGSSADLTSVVQVVDPLTLPDLVFEGTPDVFGDRIEGEVPLTLSLRPKTSQPFVQFFWEAPEATEVGSTDTRLQAIYRREGNYALTLVAHDAENHVMRKTFAVVVKPPSSSLTIKMDPETGIAPLRVNFDASETFIPGETITGFEWNFGDGAPPSVGGARIEHTFEREGTYSISLTVKSTSGEQFTTNRTISVRAPQLTACVLPSRTSGTIPLGIQFTSSCSTGSIESRLWDFGDGAQSDETNPIHVFQMPGTYNVSLTVTDATGKQSKQTVSISANP